MTVGTRALAKGSLRITELGFGSATLGNLYRRVDDEDARGAIDAASKAGIAYFDTAPFYGFGLSERRLGDALRGHSGVVISSKVGRLLVPDRTVSLAPEREGFVSPMPFRAEYDYSHDAILRSHEASLQRLGLAHIDLLLVHDIGHDTHGAAHTRYWDQLTRGGGFRALHALRDSGAIGGFGVGVNEIAVAMDVVNEADLDVVLLAGRYTLLEQGALDLFLPLCTAQKVSVIVGGPYNSGILATGTRGGAAMHYNYDAAPPAIVERVGRIEEIAEAHGIPLAAAALQFPLAHPAVACVVPGLASREQVERTIQLHGIDIPAAFWDDLKRADLLRADAPIPTRP